MSNESDTKKPLEPAPTFVCRRGPCQIDGCEGLGTRFCDYPLSGKKQGQTTCSRFMCEGHATRADGVTGLDYCPAHVAHATGSK